MNLIEGASERTRQEQTNVSTSAGKPSKITGFLRRSAAKLLFAGAFAVILSWLALTPSIGFAATVEVTSSEILVKGHTCGLGPVPDCEDALSSCMCLIGYLQKGTINMTFNPCLYPANHLSGNGISAEFARMTRPQVSETSLKESVTSDFLLPELPINALLFFAVGLVLATGLAALARKAGVDLKDSGNIPVEP